MSYERIMSGIFLFYYFFLFCYLVKNENIKIPGFYRLQVTRVFSNFQQLKELNKTKKTCEYCDLLELEIRESNKKPYCDYVFTFLILCFRVL